MKESQIKGMITIGAANYQFFNPKSVRKPRTDNTPEEYYRTNSLAWEGKLIPKI